MVSPEFLTLSPHPHPSSSLKSQASRFAGHKCLVPSCLREACHKLWLKFKRRNWARGKNPRGIDTRRAAKKPVPYIGNA